jgi:hypothetical protein
MGAQQIDTSLDRYGSLLGLPRNESESLSSYKKRIVAARNTTRGHSLEGVENAATFSLGEFELLGVAELTSPCRVVKTGESFKLYAPDGTLVETYPLKDQYEGLIGGLNPYATVTDYRKAAQNPALFFINHIDNLRHNSLTTRGNEIEVLPHSNIGTLVFHDTRYQEVSNIDYISTYSYYVDYSNGIVFCDAPIASQISYSYYDDIKFISVPAPINAFNTFDIENLINVSSISPLIVRAKNSMPNYNVWR